MAEAAELKPETAGRAEEGPPKAGQEKAAKAATPKVRPPQEKAAKTPVSPAGKQPLRAANQGGAKPPAKKSGFPKVLLLLALLLALLLVAGVCLFFDLFSWRGNLLSALASLDPEYSSYSELLAERETGLNSRENALDLREQELASREAALAAQSDSQQRQAAALDAREKELNGRRLDLTPLFRKDISEEKLTELKNLGKIYSGMEAEAAAQALSLLNGPVEMAEVLFYMDKKAASALMAALKPELAAQITAEMLRE
jgi:flagellar motility protein MotE (MotC chaperone)